MKFALILFLASSLAIACGEDSTPVDKGSEESPLTGGKEDSFFLPTDHGPANFTRPNQADISEEETFHAWTFELSSEARIELRTEISTPNLDTVMYLYHRDNEDDSWGRFIEKNDDHQGNIWSQIEGDFETGLYRVIVKPFKTSMRGSFALQASCEGQGCPVIGDGECTTRTHLALPEETGFGEGCDEALLEVVTSPLEFQNQLDVTVDQKCELNSLAAKAVDYYVSYWDDLVGFDDRFDFVAPGESVRLNVEEYTHARGTVIWIDANADEDGMRLVFDSNGELLGLHQANQSPDDRFYCGPTQNLGADFPTCWRDSVEELRYNDDDRTEEVGTITVAETGISDDLDGDLVRVIFHFSEAHDLSNDAEISYELYTWRGRFTFGAQIEVTSAELSATYWIASTELVAVSDEMGTRYLCEFVNL